MKNEIVKARFIGLSKTHNYRTIKTRKPYPDTNRLIPGNIYQGTLNMYRELYIHNDGTGSHNLLLEDEYEIIYRTKYNMRYILIGM
jgi:hypothetical protein